MQNWKLINDSAPLPRDPRSTEEVNNIPDSGFTSISHPKLKFNFTVDIEMRVTLNDFESTMGADTMTMLDVPVKNASRPSPSFVYTDVNYYNYRTKVASRTEFGACTLTFYDDADNKAQDFYKTYLEYSSRIANLRAIKTLDQLQAVPFGEFSSISSLPANAANGLVRVIRLHHFYKNKNRLMRTTYTCMNPKINSFQPDDLSMSESDVNTLTLEFNYDGLNISTEVMP